MAIKNNIMSITGALFSPANALRVLVKREARARGIDRKEARALGRMGYYAARNETYLARLGILDQLTHTQLSRLVDELIAARAHARATASSSEAAEAAAENAAEDAAEAAEAAMEAAAAAVEAAAAAASKKRVKVG